MKHLPIKHKLQIEIVFKYQRIKVTGGIPGKGESNLRLQRHESKSLSIKWRFFQMKSWQAYQSSSLAKYFNVEVILISEFMNPENKNHFYI